MIAPLLIVHEPDVLPAVRDQLSNSPETAYCGAEAIAEHLYAGRYLSRTPAVFEVEAALEVLSVEGEVLS